MSMFDRSKQDDRDFERSLLASARHDPLPPDVEGAWSKFAGAMSLATLSAESDSELSHGQPPGRTATAGRLVADTGARVVRGGTITWLIVGAIGGSCVTGLILRGGRGSEFRFKAPVAAPLVPFPVAAAEATARQPAQLSEPPISEKLAPARSVTKPAPRVVHGWRTASRAPDLTPVSGAAVVSSTLAAEVAQLDAARSASRGGDFAEAVRLVDRYHRDFPSGSLAPDAEVVAIEALVDMKDRIAISRRAARFLALYPTDPHAKRVKRLAAKR